MKFLSLLTASICAFAATAPTPPKLRLSDNVRPSRYAIDLTVVPDKDTFEGIADAEVEIQQPAELIWLNATALQIREASFRGEAATSKARVVEGANDFAGLSFDQPVRGKGVLHLVYGGRISRNSSAGLFQLKDGGEWYVYSQFEPTDARRAFPCFDQPSFKVPWQMTLHVRKNDLAFSNTPVLSETPEENGMKAVKFKETKPLPSYLVALAVGPFDVVDAGKAGHTPIRIVTPRGRAHEADYAKRAIAPLLKILEEYFGIPFPYEKLDSVAMPISNFAMENAGLITYGSSVLLSKPSSDTYDRQRAFAFTAAHEMAHQWFGDLVTTEWWNDIWLNEAFATWMERKAVAKWQPDWRADVTAVKERLGAMDLDSLTTARSIRQPIASDSDIANAFDGITYEKGAAVIRMFETSVGEDKFRKGVQLYLKQHAWGNATANDFEAAISAAAGKNIAPAFNSFLDKPGVPEITMTLDCSTKQPKLEVSQKRSLPLGSTGSPGEMWRIPVCVSYGRGDEVHRECSELDDPRSDIALRNSPGCPAWVLGNDGETGYYRVNYKGDLLNRLLKEGRARLSVAEQAGVLGDARPLVESGEMTPQAALSLVAKFSDDSNRELVRSAIGIAGQLEGYEVPAGLRANAAKFIREKFGPRANQLGWQAKPGDSEDTRLLRETLVPFVARSGEDKDLIEQARQLARTWLNDRAAIETGMLEPVLATAAEFGDRELFDKLHDAARKEQNPQMRETLLQAMGSFRNPEIAKTALALLLTDEFDMRQSFYPLLFEPLSYAETRALPFQFVKENIDALLKHLPREVGGDFAASLPETGGAFCDASERSEVQAFFKDRVDKYSGGARNLDQVLETIDLCTARKSELGPELEAFLKAY